MIEMNTELQKLQKYIKKGQKILLINHIRMDWDALGSLGAFYLLFKKLWKEVRATNDCPIPESFWFLWINTIIEPELSVKDYKPDCIIAFDSGSESQMGETYQKYKEIFQNTIFAQFDHHVSNDSYADINITDTKSSSTCELVFESLAKLWLSEYIDSQIATLLLMWILTDTNIFYNTNTTSKTFEVATELHKLWADQRLIIQQLFRKKWFQKSKLWGLALWEMKQFENWNIIWSSITQEMFDITNTSYLECAGFLNEFLANIEWAEIAYLLYELDDWSIKWSLRSNNVDINVSQIAAHFWGWGHARAAGLIIHWDIRKAETQLLWVIKQYIEKAD